MSRDNSGNYTLPSGNPVITGTVITTVWANPTMSDIAQALDDSLSRSGKGGMLAPLKNVNGSVNTPAYVFINDVNSGMYLNAPHDVRISTGNVDRIRFTDGGVELFDPVNTVWYPIITTGSVGQALETHDLMAAQTVVSFTNNVAGAALYLNGSSVDNGRLLLGTDYTYDSVNNNVNLTTSYPAGTKLTAVYDAGTDLGAAVTAAQQSAFAAGQSEVAAGDSAVAAAASEAAASASEINAASSESIASAAASAASASETNAANSESSAATDAASASADAISASASETSAANDAAAAGVSETNAAASAASAAASAASAAADAFVSGTSMLFMQAAAPVGWTKSTAHNNKALRVVSGAGGGAGGNQPFTTAFSNKSVTGTISNTTAGGSISVFNHTISDSQSAAHAHSLQVTAPTGGLGSGGVALANVASNTGAARMATVGGNQGHNHGGSFSGVSHGHSFTGTAINLAVQYVDSIICVKD